MWCLELPVHLVLTGMWYRLEKDRRMEYPELEWIIQIQFLHPNNPTVSGHFGEVSQKKEYFNSAY